MHVNNISSSIGRYSVDITFSDETEEHRFIKRLARALQHLSANCMIEDLDTDCSKYEEYFCSHNYYVVDRLTSASIFAFNLDCRALDNVIANWSYYTFKAIIAWGVAAPVLFGEKNDATAALMCMPIMISQVLDYSIYIECDKCYLPIVCECLKSDEKQKR